MKNEQKIEIVKLLALFSIPLLTISLFVSAAARDCRYIGIGFIVFGMFYFGSMSYPFLDRREDAYDVILGTVLVVFGFAFIGAGTGLYLHHYDIDIIFNFYKKIAHFIDTIFHN